MPDYRFDLVVSGIDCRRDDAMDRLFEAGCDDATISVRRGETVIEFNREAPTFAIAISTAMLAIESAGATIQRVYRLRA